MAFLVPVAASAADGDLIVSAQYAEPTGRYPHAVLGDAIEWGALDLTVKSCSGCTDEDAHQVRLTLPETRVFEDLEPRLVDLDGDGRPEVITVESDASRGARLAIYDQNGLRAATPFIGTRFRWLAPVAWGDLDGDGASEIAYVDRPHLAKTLRVWRFENDSLREIATLPGVTNHRIGWDYIVGGARDCGDGVEMVLADAGWRRIVAISLNSNRLVARDLGDYTGAESVDAARTCG